MTRIWPWVGVGWALLCGGCGSDNSAAAQALDEHQQEWQAHHPQSYVVKICGTGQAGGCTSSAVSEGKVLSARVGFPPGAFTDVAAPSGEPIAALFERAARAVSSDDCHLKSLLFEPTYAYPRDYYCDFGEEGSGETVRCFEPGTTELSACAD